MTVHDSTLQQCVPLRGQNVVYDEGLIMLHRLCRPLYTAGWKSPLHDSVTSSLWLQVWSFSAFTFPISAMFHPPTLPFGSNILLHCQPQMVPSLSALFRGVQHEFSAAVSSHRYPIGTTSSLVSYSSMTSFTSPSPTPANNIDNMYWISYGNPTIPGPQYCTTSRLPFNVVMLWFVLPLQADLFVLGGGLGQATSLTRVCWCFVYFLIDARRCAYFQSFSTYAIVTDVTWTRLSALEVALQSELARPTPYPPSGLLPTGSADTVHGKVVHISTVRLDRVCAK